MFKVDLNSLEAERQKAFGVFLKAKDQLQKVVDKATKLINENHKRVDEIEAEKVELLNVAHSAKEHMDKVNKSIAQIDTIIQG